MTLENWRDAIRERQSILCKLGILTTILAAISTYGSSRYIIGIDFQEFRCLPEVFYVIDKWDRPDATEVEMGDYIALTLPKEKLPSWVRRDDQVWIKRVVGKVPNTIMKVREDGIFFEDRENTWKHGTQLEGAERTGRSPLDYVREEKLEAGNLFLMGDLPLSYDARYFGQVPDTYIIGTIIWAI